MYDVIHCWSPSIYIRLGGGRMFIDILVCRFGLLLLWGILNFDDPSWKAAQGTGASNLWVSCPVVTACFCSASRSSNGAHCPENKRVQRNGNGRIQARGRPEPGGRGRGRGEISSMLTSLFDFSTNPDRTKLHFLTVCQINSGEMCELF